MSKPVILTGIRANNALHIGNYFGALLPIVNMAKQHAGDYEINLFVPDLHSFTTPIDHAHLQGDVMNVLRLAAAAGLPLEHPNVHIYRQSCIPAHSELTWILDCFTGFGELSRMIEFKDKSQRFGVDHIGVGQFNYPVLQAADILLYNAEYIPVGEDQRQHIEFTRNIAERLNNKFGGLFTVPKSMQEQREFFGERQGLRIKDFVDPTKKMSKSDESGRGIIFLSDSPVDATKKIKSATTDSFGKIDIVHQEQPGIQNLLQILALASNRSLDEVHAEYNGQEQYGSLKDAVAEVVSNFLEDFQARLSTVDEAALLAKLESDEYAMNDQANATLTRVQKAIGLRPKRASQIHRTGDSLKPKAIQFDHFAKIDIRVGTVLSAEVVAGSDKLIKLQVDMGTEKRQIVTGMQAYYQPADFIGKQVPILLNLAPRVMMGEESQGMLLALEGERGPVFLTPETPLPNGSPLE